MIREGKGKGKEKGKRGKQKEREREREREENRKTRRLTGLTVNSCFFLPPPCVPYYIKYIYTYFYMCVGGEYAFLGC